MQDEFASPVKKVAKPASRTRTIPSGDAARSTLVESGVEKNQAADPPTFDCNIIVKEYSDESDESDFLDETMSSSSESSDDGYEDQPNYVKDGLLRDHIPQTSRSCVKNRRCAIILAFLVFLVAFIAVSRSGSGNAESSAEDRNPGTYVVGSESSDSVDPRGVIWMPLNNAIKSDLTNGFGFLAQSQDGSIFAFSSFNYQERVGRVRVLQDIDGKWKEMGQVIHGPQNNDWYGCALDLSENGKILSVGIPTPGKKGVVRTYEYDESSTSWNSLGEIEGNNGWFGRAVSLSADGTVLAVSSSNTDPMERDNDFTSIFKLHDGTWKDIGIFAEGSHSTKLSFDGAVVGLTDVEYTESGFSSRVNVYKNDYNENWSTVGDPISIGAEQDIHGDTLGMSADGKIIAVGLATIRVYYLDPVTQTWIQMGNDLQGDGALGIALSADGMTLAVMSKTFVRVYEHDGSWKRVEGDLVGDFGTSVSLSDDGKTVVASGMTSIQVFRSFYT